MSSVREYYRLFITLESPLSIGSGNGVNTDKDVLTDRHGNPFIPASSLAGVLRSSLSDAAGNALFGHLGSSSDGKSDTESHIRIYDAYPVSGNCISSRNCVALENKVAIDGAKFDFEVVEQGASFVTYLETDTDQFDEEIEEMLSSLNKGIIRLGSKTTRGYGRVSVRADKIVFDLSPDAVDKWLDFDMYEDKCWKISSPMTLDHIGDYCILSLSLRSRGPLSIREYTTDLLTDGPSPDFRQMCLHDENETPFIAGTSWAGAFRERFLKLSGSPEITDRLFGYVRKGSVQKSKIVFSESVLENSDRKIIVRNSIDRFSSSTKDGALFTEQTQYYGNTKLDIILPVDVSVNEMKILGAVILDLHSGYLSVGGLSSVGHGLFFVEKAELDGRDISSELLDDFNLNVFEKTMSEKKTSDEVMS